MFIDFKPRERDKCDHTPEYPIPLTGCEPYAFCIPKKDLPFPSNEVLVIGFEDCNGKQYAIEDSFLFDGSECPYTERIAVAYFRVKRVEPFNCQTDEIIITDARAQTECAELYTSANATFLAGGDPAGFGSGLRAFYGTGTSVGYGMRIENAQDYVDYLVFVSTMGAGNQPYYGIMTDLGGGLVKWEIKESDFLPAFLHSPNEVKLSFCSNGGNVFDIEVIQDFETCWVEDPNGLYNCPGIAWARFTDTSDFPLKPFQSIIFTYKDLDCAPENALFELRWDDPAAAGVVDMDTYLNWLQGISGGWIINHFISGTDVYIYFNVGFARDFGVELCGGFFKFCGYSYGLGYEYNDYTPDPLYPVTQPVCCPADTLCPPRYDYWFANVTLPALCEWTEGRFYIATFSISSLFVYSNLVRIKDKCDSTLIRFRNKQNFAGQPYSQFPLFYNQIRLGFLLESIEFNKKETISQNSSGIIRKIYSQTITKYNLTTDYFDYITHRLFALALEHDEFEIYDEVRNEWVPYILEGAYTVNTPQAKPFYKWGRGAGLLIKANEVSTNTYC